MHAGVLPNAVRVLRSDRPNVHVALYNLSSSEQLEGLRQRSLDIALVSEPPTDDDPDLLGFQVLDDPMLLALPEHHPLASQARLTAADLAEQEWIGHRPRELRQRLHPRRLHPGYPHGSHRPLHGNGAGGLGAGHRHDPQRLEP